MRVGLIIYGSLDTITGGYIYNRKLVDYLRSKNIIVKIFSQQKNLIKNNFSRVLIKDILEFSPDILLQDAMNYGSLFFFNKRLKKITNIPVITIIHQIRSNIFEKLYLNSVNGFIFNSQFTKNSVNNFIPNLKNSIIAYPGKDRLKCNITQETISLKSKDKKLKIVFVANLHPGKGLHILLKALTKIDTTLWQLTVIGNIYFDPRYTKKVLKMISKLGLQNNVNILGLLDIESLKNEIISHHLLAVPSYYESFGLVYAEAMGAGLPVIASKAGGANEIIMDTKNGFLISPGDVNRIKSCIVQLIENRSLLMQMSLSSLAQYENLASWEETMEKAHHFLQGQLLFD